MSITQHEFAEALSHCNPEALAVVLDAADMRVRAGDGPGSMGKRIASALWWRTHTPVGKVAMADDLGGIIRRVARKGQIDLPESSDDRELLAALTAALVSGDTLNLAEVDPKVMKRLKASHWAEFLGVGSAGAAVGSKVVAATYLKWTAPVVDWLPYVPKVGPILVGARTLSNTVVKVAAPVGIGISLLTLNSVLGADFDRALPLLLGCGLALRDASAAPEGPLEPEVVDPFDTEHPVDDEPEVTDPEIIDAEYEESPVDEAELSEE